VYIFILTAFVVCCFSSRAQVRSSLRMKYVSLKTDTMALDTLSIAPSGFSLKTASGMALDTSCYTLDFAGARLIWKREKINSVLAPSDSVLATYRVLPMLFSESVKHKDVGLIGHDASGLINSYLYTPSEKSGFDLLKSQGLSTTGSISRGISFGNNQDVFVNSSFNLQMAGKLSDDVTILAAITDENLPIQPEGNTQQLQEFDKVFIQLTKDSSRLIAGDYELRRPDSYFMNFYKKNLGGYFTTRFKLGSNSDAPLMRVGASGAVSKGRFNRLALTAIEGNQGPYLLRGSNNETFIIVLAGSEKVYLDGHLLVRGADEDYVIDYNTAEIIFTAKRFITKDARLIVEFEYSEKSYSRSLLYFNDEVETKKMKVKFNFYSEQDSRNQPLVIELDSARKQIMSDAGDNIDSAYYNTADSVAFTPDLVLYQKKDTVTGSGTFTGIYVYSQNSDSAHWRVTFSNVGQGRGDYIQAQTAANGRVFQWVEPVGGIHQGNFAPVALLITPKQQQLMTLGGDFLLSPTLKAGVETALSHHDINLFSSKDKDNDMGYATKVFLQQTARLDHDSVGWNIRNTANYEFSSIYFSPVERYRPVEFERDWNANASQAPHDEHFITFESFLENKHKGFVNYQFRSYLKGDAYRGLMNMLQGAYHTSKWKVAGGGSYLDTKGLSAVTQYLKHNADISRTVGPVVIGVREVQEDNRYRRPGNDTLQLNSFFFQEYAGYLSTREEAKTKALLNYRYRIDKAPAGKDFRESATAQEVSLNLEFLANVNHQLKLNGTWRELQLADTASDAQPSTLLSRIDYTVNFLKGGITNSVFYEISTGQELKKEYSYLEVAPGQGAYTWKDYNDNGIKELNEFEIAAFASEANYVKIYLPTTEYVSTKGTRFSDVLNISPSVFLKTRDGKTPFLALFSNQFSVGLDKKTSDEDLLSSINPFHLNIDDSALISSNSSLRNTLFFNRTNPVYGIDMSWQRNENKSLLVNGFESRAQRIYTLNIRWSFTSVWMVTLKGETGEKANRSEFFSDRTYTLVSNSAEPKLTFQPDPATRLSLSYEYSKKENTYSESGEVSTGQSVNLEGRYSTVRMGIFTAKFSYIQLTFNGQQNTSLAYDMLEGLNTGKNLTWSLSAQRSLGNSMQLSLNYEGHKSEGTPVVHVGGMQFRAFF